MPSRSIITTRAFSLIELLVVMAILAVLAGLILPGLNRALGSARKTACRSNFHQLALAWQVYWNDQADRIPDRRDLKRVLPGGYLPWNSWPKSDPRAGWAAVVLHDYLPGRELWRCPGVVAGPLVRLEQAQQWGGFDTNSAPRVTYWMWRFDRTDDPVPAENFWGKTLNQAVREWRESGPPATLSVLGPAEVEWMVDPYFPRTVPGLPVEVTGVSTHWGGRNRLLLDGHVESVRDPRVR